MPAALRHLHWTTAAPVIAALGLGLGWGHKVLPVWAAAGLALLLGAAVLSAVHHAEVLAHKVGEPFGSLLLALAVTVIEVGMIVMLMLSGGDGVATLASETVFAAVMITTNLIVGLALMVAAGRGSLAHFNAEGAGASLACVLVIATTTMVVPSLTTSAPGKAMTGSQLAFSAVSALVIWGLFVLTQTQRHRDFFLPVDETGEVLRDEEHAAAPSNRAALASAVLLLIALVSVVGLAKTLSPTIEHTVASARLPQSVVGVVIALLVLLPETLAAVKNARRGRTQVALNLAYGSALASIGLTVPAVALVVTLLGLPLELGLDRLHIMLLALTGVVAALTVVPGRATRLQGALHLVIAATFLFFAAVP